ncbi:hypothetical protein FAF44_33835 [Nonomuraea sp. MG754425]|uniref:hypothetical protein n=1 Tax=Nonomuraea sp. MG754425 TaxID=2570319 RepID=UPI001F45BBC2|nr:hypothetical protein [Nonomuraea sp. MG754425]MCF6473329.1 hypothetical protein [Nonomuraea sp. MG754425]
MSAVSHRIGLSRLATLLAGRAVFRLMLYGSAALLALAWSRPDFNAYAATVGALGWLCMVVQSGGEKAALKLIPRAHRTRDDLVGMLRALVAYVPLPPALAAAVALAVAPRERLTLYLLGAAYYITLGCGMLGVALHRALGRYARDTVHFAVLGLGMATMAALAFLAGVGPVGYLSGLLALTTALNLSLLPGLPRRTRPPAALRRVLAGTMLLMGAADVMNNAMIGVLFVELALSPHATQSGDLYLATLGWGLALSILYTVQRIYQPQLSLRVAAGGLSGARVLARRLAGLAALGAALWLLVAGLALARGAHGPIALGVLALTLLPMQALASNAGFVVEHTDLRANAKAVVIALVAVAGLGAVTVSLAGAAGAVYALGANSLVLGLALWRAR